MAIDLKTFDFPKVDTISESFPKFNTIPELLQEATDRGFLNGETIYNEMATEWDTGSKKMLIRKSELTTDDDSWVVPISKYSIAFLRTPNATTEEKNAIVAMLWSEIFQEGLVSR